MLTTGDLGAARVVEVREPVAEPRSQVQEGRGGRVCHPRVAIGGPGRDALEQGQDRPHLRHRIQRGDEVDLRGTWVREARRDAGVDERADQCLGAVEHRCAGMISLISRTGSRTFRGARRPDRGTHRRGRPSVTQVTLQVVPLVWRWPASASHRSAVRSLSRHVDDVGPTGRGRRQQVRSSSRPTPCRLNSESVDAPSIRSPAEVDRHPSRDQGSVETSASPVH